MNLRKSSNIKYLFSFLFIIFSSLFLSYTKVYSIHKKSLKVYFAGSLFCYKDLIGNLCLSEAIERISKNKYKCFMVQNKVQQQVTHKMIKDQDLQGLLDSDIALFAFDGTELDSGTVVEFMAAKFLDKPCVVYRTDFRGGSGEEAIDEHSNKWNLMVSFYPRTKILYKNAMVEYQKVYESNKNTNVYLISKLYADSIAKDLVKEMDHVLLQKPLLTDGELLDVKCKYGKLMGISK